MVDLETNSEENIREDEKRSLCCKIKCATPFCRMDMFSIIKQSIYAEDTNPITRYFQIGRQVGSCGPEMIWKIYEAIRISDQKEASVFLFEKKIADKLHKPRRKETVSEILRKEVQHLERIKHPRILNIIHPLEECGNSLAFASEPIFASLANCLGTHDRLPVPVIQELKDYKFIFYEIQCGILQITEALSYLHSTEQLVHRNVCPQSIVITTRGTWKLTGLGFSEKIREGKESTACHPWSTKFPKMAQPDLNYIAPEIQTCKTCSYFSDMFSLGILICTIYTGGSAVIDAGYNSQQYLKQLDQLTQRFGDIAHQMPLLLVEPVEKMINKDIRYRPTAQLFSLIKFFNEPVVCTLQLLDTLEQKDPFLRAEVHCQLAQVLPDIPKKILYRNVFPVLCLECSMADSVTSALIPFIAMIDNASKDEYCGHILTVFRDVINMPKPVQATVNILNRLDIILNKSPIEEIRSEIIPLVFNCLESTSIQAQEAALNAIGMVKEYLDDSFMKMLVLPRAKALFYKATNVRVKINALSCIDHVLDSLDKMTILDEVLPLLTESQCQDASIVITIVGIYKHLLSDRKFGLTHNLIATKVMPPLITQTVNPGLTMEQFSALMEVLREMLEQIDRERRNKMKQESGSPPTQRGSLNMQNGKSKDDKSASLGKSFLSVDGAVPTGIQKSRTGSLQLPLPPTINIQVPSVPSSPNLSGKLLDEKQMSVIDTSEQQRKFSLIPPVGATPGISLIADESPCSDRPRRPSTQSLGQYSFPVSWFYDARRGSYESRHSSDKSRRPSTHSVGILPISMFGEGGQKERKPSTHSLGIMPIGGIDDDQFFIDCRHRRPSAGPFITPEFDRRGSKNSLFGMGDAMKGGQRRASFQALGESVMQFFSSK
ncbi:SCY1-like protein 2 isoform X1 [Mytilus edulis]|uniref:SCY1-like protein 2 isoform X1 n=1 Tax=Mytilus edulis TaxID=6550 RepID=UPI0039F0057B